jgi:hypothetical protein
MGEWSEHLCPGCPRPAARVFDGFGFHFQAGKGAAQANTGVHSHDYPTADQAIGRDAEARWSTYVERDKVKRQARALGGTGALARLDGNGYTEYAPLTPAGTKARATLVDKTLPALQEAAAEAKTRDAAEWARVKAGFKPDH